MELFHSQAVNVQFELWLHSRIEETAKKKSIGDIKKKIIRVLEKNV